MRKGGKSQLAPARIPLYHATLPFSSAVASRTKSFTANLMAFSGVTPIKLARIPLKGIQKHKSLPVETLRSLFFTDRLEAIPRTLVLQDSRGLSLCVKHSANIHLETSLDHIEGIHDRSTDNTCNSTHHQLLQEGNLCVIGSTLRHPFHFRLRHCAPSTINNGNKNLSRFPLFSVWV